MTITPTPTYRLSWLHIFTALFALLTSIATCMDASAQDFLGGMAPASQRAKETQSKKKTPQKKVNLPDKPNKTDEQGRKQGQWAKKYPNGRYIYEATFKDDKPVGKVKRYSEDGKLSMTLSFDKDDTCRVTTYHANGKVESKGQYYNQKREGDWLLFALDGRLLSKEPYSAGNLHGIVILYYDNGKVLETTTYVDGSREGPWHKFFPSGMRMAEGSFHKDREDGPYKSWGADGKIDVEGQYDLGTKVGRWTTRYPDINDLTNVIIYDKHGLITNQAQVDSIENIRMEFYEKNADKHDDPSNYFNNPEEYKPY